MPVCGIIFKRLHATGADVEILAPGEALVEDRGDPDAAETEGAVVGA